MKVIVVGCGGVGSALALQLFTKGHQVTVIDRNETAFNNLSLAFKGHTITGDILTHNVWQRAEVENADALAAVTGADSVNALAAHIARTEFNVPKVAARNINPRQLPLLEAFDNPVVAAASWEAQRMGDLLTGEIIG